MTKFYILIFSALKGEPQHFRREKSLEPSQLFDSYTDAEEWCKGLRSDLFFSIWSKEV